MLWYQKGGWQVLVQGIMCKVDLPSHSAHMASHRNYVLRAKYVEVSQMGQMRLELLQIPSVSCLAYIFFQFMLEGLWLALHQSVCCGPSGVKPLWPPRVSLPVASAIRNRLQWAFVEVQFDGWGWILHRMQQNSLLMSQNIITLRSGDRQWVLFGQHSSCRAGTASHFPVAIALQKAMPWVCRMVWLLFNPSSKCFSHSFCGELLSMSIHWEAPGEVLISLFLLEPLRVRFTKEGIWRVM